MAFEKKEGSGALFKNDRKEKETQPDYRGDILINGQEYWLSAWIKEGAKGKFMSLAASPKDEATKPAPKQDAGDIAGLDSDVPF
jgi:hypothetical protein